MKEMRVAIIGQGRSGRDIHGAFFRSDANDFCRVVCVVEANAERRAKAAAEYGCDVCERYEDLFERTDVDLVVNASYSQMHYPITKALLEHGFSVLTEKPLARTYFECQDLIRIAREKGVVLSAFQQTLCTPMFTRIKEQIASGKLGQIHQISLKYSGYARRWDWQTLQDCCAGGLYNSGPHPVGQALDLLGWDPQVQVAFSSLKTVITSGDADDYAKVILTAPGKPVVDIEVISSDAFAGDFNFKIFGTYGTMLATNRAYTLKYVADFDKLPPRPVTRVSLEDKNGNPAYCSEKLDFTIEEETIEGTAFDQAVDTFYHMMYAAVMEGAPLVIRPEMAAEVIRVIEAVHVQNPLPLKY